MFFAAYIDEAVCGHRSDGETAGVRSDVRHALSMPQPFQHGRLEGRRLSVRKSPDDEHPSPRNFMAHHVGGQQSGNECVAFATPGQSAIPSPSWITSGPHVCRSIFVVPARQVVQDPFHEGLLRDVQQRAPHLHARRVHHDSPRGHALRVLCSGRPEDALALLGRRRRCTPRKTKRRGSSPPATAIAAPWAPAPTPSSSGTWPMIGASKIHVVLSDVILRASRRRIISPQ